ncbi:class I SAM-dependent methyltransferase [Actinomyces bowdenii]|uniref:class I SAM-dependent methyltransferase n=1 Tax=Actinomyces bowdenii TaxID=131109 RepID=UPI00312C7247
MAMRRRRAAEPCARRLGRARDRQTGPAGLERYWNHNTAFHDEIVRDAARRGGRVLDVGCGDGLLLARLAPVTGERVGIDTDDAALARARARLGAVGDGSGASDSGGAADDGADGGTAGAAAPVRLERADLLSQDLPARLGAFQTVTCVAVLHHLPLRPALSRLAALVAPGGRLIIIGLAATATPWDWAVAAASILPARLAGWLHHETADIGVPTAPAREPVSQIRAAAIDILPGARIRRRLHYRYRLTWDRPAGAGHQEAH